MRGLEPPRPYGHTDLNRARLPIPPHPRDPRILPGRRRPGDRPRLEEEVGPLASQPVHGVERAIDLGRGGVVQEAQAQSAPASGSDSKSFFSTPTGVAAIVLMVAGVAFTVYSVNHDRKPVKSPIR